MEFFKNVLAHISFVGEVKIDFGQHADYDPAEWSRWERGQKVLRP
jgi:hypothetical protein